MIAVEKVMTCFALFYPTASATAYGQRPKFFRAEHSATAEGENCAYGPTLIDWQSKDLLRNGRIPFFFWNYNCSPLVDFLDHDQASLQP